MLNFINIPEIHNKDENCTSDPNCSAPTEKPSDISTSPCPAWRLVNHSGNKIY